MVVLGLMGCCGVTQSLLKSGRTTNFPAFTYFKGETSTEGAAGTTPAQRNSKHTGECQLTLTGRSSGDMSGSKDSQNTF
jgi:hypothetical protein